MAEQPSQAEIEEVRSKLQEIAERAKTDAGLQQQLQDDPVGALTAHGIPETAAHQLVAEHRDDAEVTGYDFQPPHCFTTEMCLVTAVNWPDNPLDRLRS